MVRDSSREWSSALAGGADTIVARATPRGAGALAVVRLSGAGTAEVAGVVCPEVDFTRPWHARLVSFHAAAGEMLEHGVAIPYLAPRSFTGEDMLEVMVHGSSYLVEAVVAACMSAGARRAGPGEFTRRALVNGKLDLLQAEAIRDLVAADTAWQARNAREQLSGRLSRWAGSLRGELTSLLAEIEASLDFAEHGVAVGAAEWRQRLTACRRSLASTLATASAGERIRDGVRVVITGPPNAGKSTLFNRLLGTERAIVSPRPGTTRDSIEAELALAGLRVVLVDTAGLGDGGDDLEAEGKRRSLAEAAKAEVVVQLWPADLPGPPAAVGVSAGRAVLRVLSKSDLGHPSWAGGWLPVSGTTGVGLERLRARLDEVVSEGLPDLGGEVAIAGRHRLAVERALSDLEGCDPGRPELAAEGLRWAMAALDELLGRVASEEVLDRVFSTFCIGK